jgi:HK97 family phage major capsid protein
LTYTIKELEELALKRQHEAHAILTDRSVTFDAEKQAEFDRIIDESKALEARANLMKEHEAREMARQEAVRSSARASWTSDDADTAKAEQRRSLDTFLRTGQVRAASATGAPGFVGGEYSVPSFWGNEVIVSMQTVGPMLNEDVVTLLPTSTGNEINFFTSNGANKGRRRGESGAVNNANTTLEQVSLNVYGYTSDFIKVPYEFMTDTNIDVVNYVANEAGLKIGLIVNEELTTGDGIGNPHGISSAVTKTVPTNAANTITVSDIITLKHSVDPNYRAIGQYMLSDTAERQLMTALDSTGRPLWQPSLIAGQAPTLNGSRYTVNPFMDIATTTGKKTAIFGDTKAYRSRVVVGGMNLIRLNERFADEGQVGYVMHYRAGGALLDKNALVALTFK